MNKINSLARKPKTSKHMTDHTIQLDQTTLGSVLEMNSRLPNGKVMQKTVQSTTAKAKKVYIEPRELIHFIDTNNRTTEQINTLTIYNPTSSGLYFRTKTTNFKIIKSYPQCGLIQSGASQEIAVCFRMEKDETKSNSNQERLTFEWIRLNQLGQATEKDLTKCAKYLNDTLKEDRHRIYIPMKYQIVKINPVSIEDCECVRNAFSGVPPKIIMVGNADSEKVEGNLILTNRSPNEIIWQIVHLNNVVPAAHPERNPMLKPKSYSDTKNKTNQGWPGIDQRKCFC